MVFASNDKLHINIAPLFLRENQTFVCGTDLKADLSKLDKYYDAFSDEIKKRGVISFAFYPPTDNSFLITRLWDKHMSSTWRENQITPKPQPKNKTTNEILKTIRQFEKEAKPLDPNTQIGSDDVDNMIIKRNVYAKKGKWMRVPPEVLNRRKNQDGEWEDIPTD